MGMVWEDCESNLPTCSTIFFQVVYYNPHIIPYLKQPTKVFPQQLYLWGLCQYRFRGGAGAASEPSGKVPGKVPNHGFREGSGTGSGAVGDNTWAYFHWFKWLQQCNQLSGDPKASLRQEGIDPSPTLSRPLGATDAVGIITDAAGEVKEEHS